MSDKYLMLEFDCHFLKTCNFKSVLSMQAFNSVKDALLHDCADVRAAACICMRNVSRSVQVCSRINDSNIKIVFRVDHLDSSLIYVYTYIFTEFECRILHE